MSGRIRKILLYYFTVQAISFYFYEEFQDNHKGALLWYISNSWAYFFNGGGIILCYWHNRLLLYVWQPDFLPTIPDDSKTQQFCSWSKFVNTGFFRVFFYLDNYARKIAASRYELFGFLVFLSKIVGLKQFF